MSLSNLSATVSKLAKVSLENLSEKELQYLIESLKEIFNSLTKLAGTAGNSLIKPGSTIMNPIPSNAKGGDPFWMNLPISLETVNATQEQLQALLASAEKTPVGDGKDVLVSIGGPKVAM